jgi:hypothetical protein
MLEKINNLFEENKINNLGIVINDLNSKDARYYGYGSNYGYGYHYNYGYYENESQNNNTGFISGIIKKLKRSSV